MIFTNSDGQLDKDVRLAAHHAIDKQAFVKLVVRLWGSNRYSGCTGIRAFDPTIRVGYDSHKAGKLLASAGFWPQKPFKTTIQTTRGFKPKYDEMIQANQGKRAGDIERDVVTWLAGCRDDHRRQPRARRIATQRA